MYTQRSTGFPLTPEPQYNEFTEMYNYSVQLYQEGIIRQNESGELFVTDYSKIDFAKLDLDAVRMWLGMITLQKYN